MAARCTDNMHATELKLTPGGNCTSEGQPDLSDRMRAILVSWLIEVHLKFQLLPETLYITINLIDRYCEAKTVPRSEY